MRGKLQPACDGRFLSWVTGLTCWALTWTAAGVLAQQPSPAGAPAPFPAVVADASPIPTEVTAPGGGIEQTGCATCGGGGGGCGIGWRPLQTIYEDDYQPGACPSCCYPGRLPCDSCWGADDGFLGKCCGGLRQCLCCPDPCYVPSYVHAGNAAFFVTNVRPVTYMMLQYEPGWNMTSPDRAEFVMPRFRTTPPQVLANGGATAVPAGKGLPGVARKIDYQALSLYTEAATAKFGVFIQQFYSQINPFPAPITPAGSLRVTSGFGDMLVGTKAVLLDCELMLLTFQFQTYIPVGNFTQGLGTGHVSLEPSLLTSIKLAPDFYFQGQSAYWIPIGGDPNYQGNVWHNHLSLNRVLRHWGPGTMLIGTAEVNEWTVLNGDYTSPTLLIGGAPVAHGAFAGIVSAGPGLRMVVCNSIDFGVGTAFAITNEKWADQLIRAQLRWRF
jgi:hypothetical protein